MHLSMLPTGFHCQLVVSIALHAKKNFKNLANLAKKVNFCKKAAWWSERSFNKISEFVKVS